MPSILQPGVQHRDATIYCLLDCSHSMDSDGKISQLNYSMSEFGAGLEGFQVKNPNITLKIQAVTFGGTVERVFPVPVKANEYAWHDLSTSGGTPLGQALHLLADELRQLSSSEAIFAPVVALISDGQPTDDWENGLAALLSTHLGKSAQRRAVAIGDDCDRAMLQDFIGNREIPIVEVADVTDLPEAIVKATLAPLEQAVANKSNLSNPILPEESDEGGLAGPNRTLKENLNGGNSLVDDANVENDIWIK